MKFQVLLSLCVVLFIAPIAGAVEMEHQEFPKKITVNDTPLVLHGCGLLKVAVIFKVYVAALYLGDGVTPDRVFEDVPKRIEIAYLRAIDTNIIFEAGNAALSNNVPPAELAELQPRVDQINAMYENVDKGDRYAITYLPGRGTELTLNGESQGVVEGADFASAYFKIWLGKKVAKPELRDALLGRTH